MTGCRPAHPVHRQRRADHVLTALRARLGVTGRIEALRTQRCQLVDNQPIWAVRSRPLSAAP